MTTVEYELDDVHRFMVQEMKSDELTVEEFVENLINQSIYNTYKEYKRLSEQ